MKPINPGNSSFKVLIENGYIYVDKTALFYRLVSKSGKFFFCARPRRFGKSLAVSTLEAIFQGKRELFKGLAIDSLPYDWKPYPVVRIDFTNCDAHSSEELEIWLHDAVLIQADNYGLTLPNDRDASAMFSSLLGQIIKQHGDVVVLVDEYDKVVNDNGDQPLETVKAIRAKLSGFYQPIKAFSERIRFAFLTGVTRYTKMGIFSGLNNLRDISMNKEYATLFGYTQRELEDNFADYIDQGVRETGLSREAYLAELKEMYDGYRFHEDAERVYNPVSVGLFFLDGGTEFRPYWFETGGNTKLIMDVAKETDFSIVTSVDEPVSASSLRDFDITALRGPLVRQSDLKWLLYQAGYLTIASATVKGGYAFYRLQFPNREVRSAFSEQLLEAYAPMREDSASLQMKMMEALEREDTATFFRLLSSLYGAVPYPTRPHEYHFSTALYLLVYLWNPSLAACEIHTSEGRIDLAVRTSGPIYLFEFKVDQDAETALSQIEDKAYYQRFLPEHKPIHLVGVSFDSAKRNVAEWKEKILDAE